MKHITTLSQKENKTMKTLLSATLLLSTFLLTACGGGGSSGSSSLPPVSSTPPPTAGCYGTNPNGTSVYLGDWSCSFLLKVNPSKYTPFQPLTTVGNPPSQ